MLTLFVALLQTLTTLTLANEMSSLACDSLESLKQTREVAQLESSLQSRTEIQNFLKNANVFVQQKIEAQDYDSAAVACGMIDEATAGFTKPCVDNDNNVIDLSQAQSACETLKSQN